MDATQNNIAEQVNTTQRYEVLQELGDCYASIGNYDQAQKHYEKAASSGPDEPGPYVGLGVVALQKNLLDDAGIAFKVACRLDPDCSKAYAGLGLVAQQSGDSSGLVSGFLPDGLICQSYSLSRGISGYAPRRLFGYVFLSGSVYKRRAV